jgi:RNA polymerase sigma factor (sigma-70 family)
LTATAATETFTTFVDFAEPRLRRALVVAYGEVDGREAVAEALAYAWEHWDRVQVMANPVGYLYRVGRTRGLSLFRRPPRLPRPDPDESAWFEPGLPAALERLSEKQRAAVLLVKGFGWTYGEVAQLWGVGISTVQQHVERGLAKLRRSLGVSGHA